MGIIETGAAAVKTLLPPGDPNDEAAQTRWRWTIFAAIVGLGIALTAHIILACGLLPMFYPGFALASDNQRLHKQLNVIETITITNEMLRESSKICHTKDADERLRMNQYMAKLQLEYHDIADSYLPLPGCDAQ